MQCGILLNKLLWFFFFFFAYGTILEGVVKYNFSILPWFTIRMYYLKCCLGKARAETKIGMQGVD